jgi:predicted flap endonuclease-1-like 5' DNA nuclease
MTDCTAYRQRVATLRGRSRAQLAAIRKERLSRMRTGPKTTDPLASAWVADQRADEDGWREVPARSATLALVSATPGQDIAAVANGELPDDLQAVHAEEVEPEPASDPGADIEGASSQEEDAADDARAEAMAHLGDDLVDLPDVDARAPTEHSVDPFLLIAESAVTYTADAVVADLTYAPADLLAPGDAATPPMASPPVVADAATRTAAAPPAEPPIRDDTTDLSEIPGIGPGLIWMLREAGVATLADLVRADTPELARKLGAIARLLDLDWFIDFARTRGQPEISAGPAG